MLAALNTKEAQSKQRKQKYDDIPNYKIGDFIMIRNFDKNLTGNAKYISNLRVVCLIGSKQLEVSNPTGRIRKINVSVMCI